MGKVVDGVELLRMIKKDELKYGTRIKNTKTNAIYVYYDGTALWRLEENKEMEEICISVLVTGEFEIISEEDEELDIDSIEELYISNIKSVGESEIKCWTGRNLDIVLANKINELIKAVKQLNKQHNEPIDNHIPRID